MSIQSDIATALATITGVESFPQHAEQDTKYPFVIYRKLSADPLMTLQGYGGMTKSTFVFECWAQTYQGVITLVDQVRTAVEAAAALKPFYREQGDPDDYEPAVDVFVEPVLYSFWHP